MAGVAIAVLVGPFETAVQCANALFLGCGLSLTFSVTAGLLSFASRRMPIVAWTLFVPCAAVAVELLTSAYAPVGSPLSQHSNHFALWIASCAGPWGVTFLLWLVPAALVVLFAGSRSRQIRFAAITTILVVGVAIFLPIHPSKSLRILRTAAVQAPDSSEACEQTQQIAGKADIVAWPEHLLDSEDKKPIEAAESADMYVVANYVDQSKSRKAYNTACLVAPDGQLKGAIRKHHLYGNEIYRYGKGGWSKPIKSDSFNAGLAICYDTVFPDVVRHLASAGADVILVPCGDPESPNSLFEHLHSAHVAFRAAENGIPIVWADGNSLSAIFDSDGSVVARARPHRIETIIGTVHVRGKRTLYTIASDYFAYLCSLFVVLLPMYVYLTRRKNKQSFRSFDHR